jgi:hypothetical protein
MNFRRLKTGVSYYTVLNLGEKNVTHIFFPTSYFTFLSSYPNFHKDETSFDFFESLD